MLLPKVILRFSRIWKLKFLTHSTSNANVSYDESGVYEINNDVLLPVKFCISFRISENCCLGIFADDFFFHVMHYYSKNGTISHDYY